MKYANDPKMRAAYVAGLREAASINHEDRNSLKRDANWHYGHDAHAGAVLAWCEAVEREYGVAEQRESEEAR